MTVVIGSSASARHCSSPGIFTISLDFELYWGTRDHRTLASYGSNILGCQTAIPAMLELFEEFEIHATWAVVGFVLFADKEDLGSYVPKVVPEYAEARLNPYPAIDEIGRGDRVREYFFAPELVARIRATPFQELGTHTFSHYYCLEEGQTPAAFEADLTAAREATRAKFGSEVQSLVFPRNQFNARYLELCRRAGIRAYRGNQRSWVYEPKKGAEETKLRRAIRLVDSYINLTGHHGHRVSGAPAQPIDVPASRFLRPWSRSLRLLEPLRLRRIEHDLAHCARHGLLYHLWWHPDNFGANTRENVRFLRGILERFRSLREEHGMRSLTMGEVAELAPEGELGVMRESA